MAETTPGRSETDLEEKEVEETASDSVLHKEQPSETAESPEKRPEAPPWLIENIAEASKNARSIYLLYLGFLAYCALTVISTSDRQLLLNEGARLPIISVDIPLNIFFVVAPILAAVIFCYLQLYLQKLKSLRVNLQEKYAPVGRNRLYPWMINVAKNPKPGVIGRLQKGAVQISLWWLLPLTLTLFTLWFLKNHLPVWSHVMGLVPAIGVTIVLYFWSQYDDREHWLWESKPKFLMVGVTIVFELYILLFAIPRSLDGKTTLGRGFFLDLSNQVLITEKAEEYDLPWLELRNVYLEGAILSNTILRNADLRGASMTRANLGEAQMQGANLGGVKLQHASLKRANLDDANLDDADLQNTNLRYAHLADAWLYEADLRNTNFSSANLANAHVASTQLEGADFSGAEMPNSNLSGARCDSADFAVANLQNAEIREAELGNSDFRNADLRNANLRKIQFKSAHLQRADFRDANLRKAQFGNSNLMAAKLSKANLPGADLQNTKLTQAKFVGANLSGAQLQGANLWGTRLDSADLSGADLRGVSFERPRIWAGWSPGLPTTRKEILCSVKTLYNAELDSSSSEMLRRECPQVLEKPVTEDESQ